MHQMCHTASSKHINTIVQFPNTTAVTTWGVHNRGQRGRSGWGGLLPKPWGKCKRLTVCQGEEGAGFAGGGKWGFSSLLLAEGYGLFEGQ